MQIVLLPGLEGTGDLFAEFVAVAPATETVHVVSYPAEHVMTYPEHAVYAKQHLPASGDYVVLGESFSGPVAVLLAAEAPPGLRGVILVNTFVTRPSWAGFALLPWRWLLAVPVPRSLAARNLVGRERVGDFIGAIRAANRKHLPAVRAARMRAVLRLELRETFRRLEAPVLYLRGSRDRFVKQRCLDAVVATRPDVRVARLAGPHHLLQVMPRESWKVILDFLGSLPEAPAGVGAGH